MSYLAKFYTLLEDENFSPILSLWEEYSMGGEQVDGEELFELLTMIKESHYSNAFGHFVETALPLWEKIDNEVIADNVLRLIIDLQTTNTPPLADLATHFLATHYKDEPDFSEKMRIIGLRSRRSFQRAITNYELLSHMQKDRFVFHTGGWGVGEVMDISLLQEHVIIEFEGTGAKKDLSFENVFKNIIYIPKTHFLARRFGDPDKLEAEGRKEPCALIHLLLKDLGPKTAQEIKEELSELVIPEDDWSKWWQSARTKIKKDTMIKSPKSSKGLFELRLEGVPHEVRFKEALKVTKSVNEMIQTTYNFTRDFPEVIKNTEIQELLKEHLVDSLSIEDGGEQNLAHKVQISFLLEDIFPKQFPNASASLIQSIENLEGVIKLIDILAFKKRTLVSIRKVRQDWDTVFLHLLFVIGQNALRDFIFRELYKNAATKERVTAKINELLHNMTLYIEPFFWYFQKLQAKEDIPFNDEHSMQLFLESYLILLHYIEDKPEYRDLVKKMQNQLTGNKFEMIRSVIHGASVEYLREFLLLSSKCISLTKHDLRVLHSLAEIVQPALAQKKEKVEDDVIWTTSEGYQKLQQRVQTLGTTEMIENAREIEEARAHGDLRENHEYKLALEKRSRLQGELKMLSRQLNHARILTKNDVITSEVGPGSIVKLEDPKGEKIIYTLLGPWDADPEQNILSFQSKFAQAMMGHEEGDSFNFQGNDYSINSIHSYLS